VTNPLLEADPSSLNELFNRDPLGLSDRDLDLIVAEQRVNRARYEASLREGKKPKAAKEAGKAKEIDLGELDL
jgi:hypothetical protein